MISYAFLKAEMSKTRSQKRVSPFLRRLISSVVTQTAEEHYGVNYYDRSMPVSLARTGCLALFGVMSDVWAGAFCVPEFFPNSDADAWGGFWDRHFHTWATTEFGEIIDLNAALMPQQRNVRFPGGIPMPPVWWNDGSDQAPIIRYLPDTVLSFFRTGPNDMADVVAFVIAVEHALFETLAKSSIESVQFEPFIEDLESMQRLFEAGHPWLNRAIAVDNQQIPLPDWIVDRENEIRLAALIGRQAPTRLAGIIS